MRSRISHKGARNIRNSNNTFSMDPLEQRLMLDASPRTTPTEMDWRGGHYTNISQGSWVLTFTSTQSQAQATARAAQVATALGVQTSAIEVTPRGQFARIQTNGVITENAVDALRAQLPFLRQVEPETLAHVSAIPNDARYGEQWAHNNTGQVAGYSGIGTPGADISSPEAWNISTGSRSVIIAVLDTGADLTHPDLKANLWKNPGEIPGNGVDDDQNGFVDDVNGWDFGGDGNTTDANPQDPATQGHGTAVSGVIGAVGNNAIGVAGVNWQVSIMVLKIFPDQGLSPLFAQLGAYDYCVLMKQRGINIIASNNSFGSLQPTAPFDNAAQVAIQAFVNAGILYVAAAGNDSNDNDGPLKAYPASYPIDDIISAAATTNKDDLAGFSNFGATTVDLGAPGEQVLTLATGGGYQLIDGTSFASPYTAGVIGLMASVNRFATKAELKAALFGAVDPVASLAGKVITGGRLNSFKAVRNSRVDGLFVTNISPGTQSAEVSRIDVEFSSDVNPSFFDIANISFKRANGAATFNGSESTVTIDPAQVTLSGKRLTITFPIPLPRDLYRLSLASAGFRDAMGNRLNGDMTTGNDEVYDFSVVAFSGPFEPNDTLNTATPVLVGINGEARLDDLFIGDGAGASADVDIFKIYASGPSLITAAVQARSLAIYSSLDSYLRIFDGAGNELARNDNFEGLDSKIQIFVPGAGDYYIAVSAYPNFTYPPGTDSGRVAGGSTGTFSLLLDVDTSGRESVTKSGAGTPLPIPALGEITSSLTVADGRSVSDLTVTVAIAHTFLSDIRVTLTGPQGQVVTLMDRRGGINNGASRTYTFDDASFNPISAMSVPASGTYRPEQQLTPFKGASGAGVWTLRITDLKPLDSGTLQSWSINFSLANDITGPFELNDTQLLATETGINETGSRTFNAGLGDGAFGLRDVDLYRFIAGSGTTITAAVTVASGSSVKSILRLFDAQGNEVRADRRGGVTSNLVTFVVASAGVYYVGVSGGKTSSIPGDVGNDNYTIGVGGSGNPTDATGNYTLTLTVSGGISEGAIVLTGDHLTVGINSNGALGIPTGSSPVGLAGDGLDYLLAGANLGSFYGASFDGFFIRNTGDRSQSDLPVSINNESDYFNRRVVASGLYRSLGVRRSISFANSGNFLVVDVAMSNRSTQVMNNVAWLEGFSPFQGLNGVPPTATQTNNVLNTSGGRLAYSTINGKTIGIGAPVGDFNTITTFAAPNTARDIFTLLASPLDPDPSLADTGATGTLDMTVAVNVGSIAPNQTIAFRYFIFLGDSLGAVTGAFQQVETGTGSGHLVADPTLGSIPPASLPYALFYPEGYANDRASTFLPIINGNPDATRVVVIAHYEGAAPSEVLYDSATDSAGGVIAPGSRAGITLTNPSLYAQGTATRVKSEIPGRPGVLKNTPYALEIRSSLPVGATMSHYDFNISTGQSAISTLSTVWTFAEGQKGGQIRDFVVFLNTNTSAVKVTMTTFPTDGSAGYSLVSLIQPGHRGGFSINDIPQIKAGKFGVKIDAELPIIAALTHFDPSISAGYAATGLPALGTTSGGTAQGQVGLTANSEAVSILNLNASPASVTFTFAFANSSAYRKTVTVQGNRRGGFVVSNLPNFPKGQPYSVTYTSTLPVTVNLPSYTKVGSSGATLTNQASTQWLFGEGFKPVNSTAVQEFLRVYNPASIDSTVEIAMNFSDGTSEVFRRTVPARATGNFNLFDFVTGYRSTIGTVPGIGSFYGIRVVSSVPVVAFFNHYDAFLGGGFGMLGTPIGTTGSPA